jgi:hypothetical protein
MSWNTIFLILAIIVAVLGIWNLARKRTVFVSLIGIVWFIFVLFRNFVPDAYNYLVVSGLTVGDILEYLVVPVFLIIAFLTPNR